MAKFKGTLVEQEGPSPRFGGTPVQLPQVEEVDPLQQRYDEALEAVRQQKFSDVPAEKFAKFAERTYAPYGPGELADHSISAGLLDEINASGSAAVSGLEKLLTGNGPGFGEAYTANKELEEARRDLGREQSGKTGAAAEIAGGFVSVGPGKALSALLPLWQKAGIGAAQGAGLGGAYGAGAADDNRIVEGVKGGGLGAIIGAGLPAASAAVGKGYSSLRNLFTSKSNAAKVGMSPEAARFLSETVNADDTLSAAGRARMNEAGQEQMLADAGESAKNALDTAIQKSGGAGKVAREAVDARVSREGVAIRKALDETLGVPEGVEASQIRIRQSTAAGREKAYKEAYEQPIDYASDVGRTIELLIDRVDGSVIKEANKIMRADGHRSKQILAKMLPNGKVTYERLPDVRQIDYITRALNDISAASAAKPHASLAYQNLSSALRGATKEAVHEYGSALAKGADNIERVQAVKFGSELMRASTTREQVAMAVTNMSGAEKTAALQGLRSNVDDVLARVQRTATDGKVDAREALSTLKQFSSRANRQKVTILVGKENANKLFSELDRAAKSFELKASVADNTKTFQRQDMDRRVTAFSDPDGPISTLAKGEPLNAGKRAVQALTGQTPEKALQRKDQIYAEISEVLTRNGGSGADAMEVLKALAFQTGKNTQAGKNIADIGQRLVIPTSETATRLAVE